jgi:hypothetical protein
MKPCTMRGPEIDRKKILVICNVENFDNQLKAVVGAHMKGYRNKWQTTAGHSIQYCNSFTAFTR